MRVFTLISKLMIKNPVKSILISIVIVMLFAAGVPGMKMATGNETLVEEESKAYRDNLALEKEFGGESIIVLYEAENAEDLLTIDTVKHMNGLEKRLDSYEEIYTMISPNTMINQISGKQSDQYKTGLGEISTGLNKMGSNLTDISKKLNQNPGAQQLGGGQKATLTEMNGQQTNQKDDFKTMSAGLSEMGNSLLKISENQEKMVLYSDNMAPGLPEKQQTLEKMIYDEDGNLRDLFSEVVIDEKNMIFIVKLEGDVDDSKKSAIASSIKDYLKDHELDSVETMVSGKPVLDDSIRTSMKESMQKMLGLSILFMILVLTIIFKVRWRLLPLGVTLLAVVATVGLMGWLSIPMTMVSMAVFPILIGLGIDYAIQFQSRYSEEMDTGGDA